MEGSPLVGPDADPAGWKVLPSVKINGMLFGTRNIEVTCTVRSLVISSIQIALM